MNRLSPLLELRGQWREAAAVTIPAAAAELVEVLDRALDLLDAHGQLDESGLTLAIETICGALKGRPEEVELLRHRLRRAARDYTVATAMDGVDAEASGEAFASEQALAEALFGLGSGETPTISAPDAPAAAPPAPARLDEQAMRKSLSGVRKRRRAWAGLIPVLIVLALIGGALYYFVLHPPAVVVTPGGPGSTGGQAALGGSFHGTSITCDGGTQRPAGCAFDASLSGVTTVKISWIPPDASLTLSLEDATGHALGTPKSGTGGQLSLTTPNLTSGHYVVVVSPTTAQPAATIQFQLASA